MDERLRRLTENDEILDGLGSPWSRELHEFVCECTELACRDILHLTAAEYKRVRAVPGRFVVMPGHEDAGAELVVEAHPRYRVVEPGSVVRGLRS